MTTAIHSPYAYTTDVWPALITLAIVTYLGLYAWRRRSLPAAKPFVVACVLGDAWILGVILELSAVDFTTKVAWVKFQALWQLPVAATITCFVLLYAGLGRWLSRLTYSALFIVPVASALVVATNGLHHLMWTGFRMDRYVVGSPGMLYWIFNGYVLLLGLLNLAVLTWLALRSPAHRLPVAILVSCQVVARIVYVLDKLDTGLIGPGESVLLTIGVVAVAYAVALLRFHAIDPVAASREAALQQMQDGLIVLDLEHRIADVNARAAAMLGVPADRILSTPIEDALPGAAGDLDQIEDEATGQAEITLGKGRSARHYRLALTALRGRHGEVIARLILLHDVTEQARAQTLILEQQRLVATLQERERLARELHDGIGQTLGYVSMQAQSALKRLQDGDAEKAASLLDRLVEVAMDAHADVRESILGLTVGSGQRWSFLPALREYMDKFQANYGIRTELSLSTEIDDSTFDPGTGAHLMRVIQEAMTNARKHSEAGSMRVCMERDDGMARVSIVDDGRGFAAGQLERGGDGHFGLVFMRERVAQVGGSLRIESVPGAGTKLTLDVPIAEQ